MQALGAEGRTLVVSSHQLVEIQQLCSDIVMVVKGKKRFAGPMGELAGNERLRLRVGDAKKASAVVAAAGFVLAPAADDDGADVLIVEAAHARAPELASLIVTAGVALFALEPLSFDLEQAVRAA